MGFENEKDHPEVAPSQFEMNFKYADALIGSDEVQLYKLLARQVAAQLDLTASFLPKPVTGVNGNGMHSNLSLAKKGVNTFFDKKGKDGLSKAGWDFISRILSNATDICLVLNSSVNSYRRLDPHYEAPNQIKASAIDRGAMVRIPLGNQHSARIEVRSVAPDANPYMSVYTILRTGLEGPLEKEDESKRSRTRFVPDYIYDAVRLFKGSKFSAELFGEGVHNRFAELKMASADRCPRALGARVKDAEVMFHHEITNQYLWNQF
jgi:glutamine synthetase